MFTGIIEEIGMISSIIRKGQSARVTVSMKRPFSDTARGDSIAVDGVCLTVSEHNRNSFSADISEESMKVSNLSSLKIGDKVNLERALSFSSRLGGHIMSGHVDGVIELKEKITREGGYELIFAASPAVRRYIVPKGSVGIDGVSLTVARVLNNGFSVSLIPHTAQYTTLGSKQIGNKLNLEADILSKYVEGLMQGEAATPTEKMFIDSGFLPMGMMEN